MATPSTSGPQASWPRIDSRCEVAGTPSCSMAIRWSGSARGRGERAGIELGAQRGLALQQVGGADQREQPRRLVPARLGDVPLGLQQGAGQGVAQVGRCSPMQCQYRTVTRQREPQGAQVSCPDEARPAWACDTDSKGSSRELQPTMGWTGSPGRRPPGGHAAPARAAGAHDHRGGRPRAARRVRLPAVGERAVVPVRRLHQGVQHHAERAGAAVRGRGAARRRRRRGVAVAGLPDPAGLRAGVARAGEPGPLPRAGRAAAQAGDDRAAAGGRPDRRRRHGRALADLPAVAAPARRSA